MRMEFINLRVSVGVLGAEYSQSAVLSNMGVYENSSTSRSKSW